MHHRREAVACDPDGIALFELIRYHWHDQRVFLRAFDIIELNGDDLRREALVSRKAMSAIALAGCRHRDLACAAVRGEAEEDWRL